MPSSSRYARWRLLPRSFERTEMWVVFTLATPCPCQCTRTCVVRLCSGVLGAACEVVFRSAAWVSACRCQCAPGLGIRSCSAKLRGLGCCLAAALSPLVVSMQSIRFISTKSHNYIKSNFDELNSDRAPNCVGQPIADRPTEQLFADPLGDRQSTWISRLSECNISVAFVFTQSRSFKSFVTEVFSSRLGRTTFGFRHNSKFYIRCVLGMILFFRTCFASTVHRLNFFGCSTSLRQGGEPLPDAFPVPDAG
jgi:hypothetical protein